MEVKEIAKLSKWSLALEEIFEELRETFTDRARFCNGEGDDESLIRKLSQRERERGRETIEICVHFKMIFLCFSFFDIFAFILNLLLILFFNFEKIGNSNLGKGREEKQSSW